MRARQAAGQARAGGGGKGAWGNTTNRRTEHPQRQGKGCCRQARQATRITTHLGFHHTPQGKQGRQAGNTNNTSPGAIRQGARARGRGRARHCNHRPTTKNTNNNNGQGARGWEGGVRGQGGIARRWGQGGNHPPTNVKSPTGKGVMKEGTRRRPKGKVQCVAVGPGRWQRSAVVRPRLLNGTKGMGNCRPQAVGLIKAGWAYKAVATTTNGKKVVVGQGTRLQCWSQAGRRSCPNQPTQN